MIVASSSASTDVESSCSPEDRVPRPALPLHLASSLARASRSATCACRRRASSSARRRRRRRAWARGGRAPGPRRLVVLRSRCSSDGEEFELDSAPLTIGRGGQNDVSIDGDEFASARHVRIEPRRDGVWVQRSRLDERHVRERRAHRPAAQARRRRRRPRRRDRPEVRGMSVRERSYAVRATRDASGGATRTRTSSHRRSSPSPTAWAARRRARSRRSSPPPRSRTPIPARLAARSA